MDVSTATFARRPRALVYRGPAGDGDLSKAVAQLLESSPQNFEVQYAGPKETVDITRESLSSVDLYAQPGGPGTFANPSPSVYLQGETLFHHIHHMHVDQSISAHLRVLYEEKNCRDPCFSLALRLVSCSFPAVLARFGIKLGHFSFICFFSSP